MSERHNVETLVVLQPIAVNTGSPDQDGRLVLANGLLVAVLVKLEMPDHDDAGSWFIEAALGRLQGQRAPLFDSLEESVRWIRHRLRRSPDEIINQISD